MEASCAPCNIALCPAELGAFNYRSSAVSVSAHQPVPQSQTPYAICRLSAGLAVLLPQHLNQHRLIDAAHELLAAYPALGARCDSRTTTCSAAAIPHLLIDLAWSADCPLSLVLHQSWMCSSQSSPSALLTGQAQLNAASGLPLSGLDLQQACSCLATLCSAVWRYDGLLAERAQLMLMQLLNQGCMQPASPESGSKPLFKLRVTNLGCGSCILAASWLHLLTDGESTPCTRLTACLKSTLCPCAAASTTHATNVILVSQLASA